MVCDAGYGDTTAYDSGALGSILHDDNNKDDLSQVPILPTTMLMMEEHNVVKSYINSTRYRFVLDNHKAIALS